MEISKELQQQAENYLVGGVSAGWNAFPVTGPIRFKKAQQAYLYDVEDNKYIDWTVGWGSLMLGHNPDILKESLLKAFDIGFGFQSETEYHIQLAQTICALVPCAEKVRLANSGLEATLYAIRLAREYTGKNKIIKFEGHFHGLHDYLLYDIDTSPQLGEVMPNGDIQSIPGSSGIPKVIDELLVTLPFNDLTAFEEAVQRHEKDLAGVILEPIALNMGCVKPAADFIKGLREITKEKNIVLIFDEIMTGFRANLGGAQLDLGVIPDLACLGKALGCGFPIAALAGKKEIMQRLSPVGSVQMSGTNSGRVLAVIGSLAALQALQRPGFYEHVNQLNDYFISHCSELMSQYRIPGYVDGYGGRIGIFFGLEEKPKDLRHIVKAWNKNFHKACYTEIVKRKRLFGFLLPLPNCPEPVTLSGVHTHNDIDETLNLLEDVFKITVPKHSFT